MDCCRLPPGRHRAPARAAIAPIQRLSPFSARLEPIFLAVRPVERLKSPAGTWDPPIHPARLERADGGQERGRSAGTVDGAAGNNNRYGEVVVTTSAYAVIHYLELAQGRFLTEYEVAQRTKSVVIGANVAQSLSAGIDAVGQSLRINREPYTVVGVLRKRGYGWFGSHRHRGEYTVSEIHVNAVSVERVDAARRQVEQTLRLDAAPGAKVSPGTALADPTRLELTVQVAEVDIPGIESGRTADVLIDAFPDQIFAGVISRIEPFTETQNGVISYPVTIQLLDNALDSVLPGMTAVAALRSEAAGDRWLVPSTAIQEVDGATVVTVVRGQERLPLAVTPEGLHGEWTIVRSAGLQDGDEVADAIASFGEE